MPLDSFDSKSDDARSNLLPQEAVSHSEASNAVSSPMSLTERVEASRIFYNTATLEEILEKGFSSNFGPGDEMFPLQLFLAKHDEDWSVSRRVFSLICKVNPRIWTRYDYGRLIKPNDGWTDNFMGGHYENGRIVKPIGKGLDVWYVNMGKSMRIRHLDKNGEWIEDMYVLDEKGNAKFETYVTEENEGRYFTAMDLATAHGSMKEPHFRAYTWDVPPSVYDPLVKAWLVRRAVVRILDMAVL